MQARSLVLHACGSDTDPQHNTEMETKAAVTFPEGTPGNQKLDTYKRTARCSRMKIKVDRSVSLWYKVTSTTKESFTTEKVNVGYIQVQPSTLPHFSLCSLSPNSPLFGTLPK